MSPASRPTTVVICWRTMLCVLMGPRRRPRKSPRPEDGIPPAVTDARPPVRPLDVQVRPPNDQVRPVYAAASSSPPTTPRRTDRRRPRCLSAPPADRHPLQRPGTDPVEPLQRCLSATGPLQPRCLSALLLPSSPRWRYRRGSGPVMTTPAAIIGAMPPRLAVLHLVAPRRRSNQPSQPSRTAVQRRGHPPRRPKS